MNLSTQAWRGLHTPVGSMEAQVCRADGEPLRSTREAPWHRTMMHGMG